MTNAVSVTITSDLICPWCYVGVRKLQEASKLANVDIDISWKPYMLLPGTPPEGIPKRGTPSSRVGELLKMTGKSVGIDFTGLTDRTPNTSLFHATLQSLNGHDKQTAFHEAVFDAYFTRGIFPDESGLLQCAEEVGVGREVSELFANAEKLQENKDRILHEVNKNHRRGIHDVPYFEFEGEPGFSGAQDLSMFVKYLGHYYAVSVS